MWRPFLPFILKRALRRLINCPFLSILFLQRQEKIKNLCLALFCSYCPYRRQPKIYLKNIVKFDLLSSKNISNNIVTKKTCQNKIYYLESIISKNSSQIWMIVKINTVHVPDFSLVPVTRWVKIRRD